MSTNSNSSLEDVYQSPEAVDVENTRGIRSGARWSKCMTLNLSAWLNIIGFMAFLSVSWNSLTSKFIHFQSNSDSAHAQEMSLNVRVPHIVYSEVDRSYVTRCNFRIVYYE